MAEKYYVTTPIYYPNDIPHIGHAYTTIVADVLARWNKLLGKDVHFLTGTDDHGKKIADTAKKAGKKPKEFVDSLIPEFKDAWKKLGIKYDRFIRTTDSDHEKNVQEMLQKSFDNGDIYKGTYEGLYCTGCEAYYTEKDLEDGKCPVHKRSVEKVKEETYFFKLSKYEDKLLELYENNPEFISPKNRRQEIINRVKEGLRDLSISRTSFDWGIKLPFDEKHICYVWFDALFNYVSGADGKWPADVHLIGKDIIWFHTVYWPAFLMSVGLELPKKIFAHGWWTFDKEKISKSVGKVINVDELVNITGNKDSARYFLCRATAFGDDGDFSTDAVINRHNGELLNKLGNLVARVTGLIEKYGFSEPEVQGITQDGFKLINERMQNLEVDKALNAIFILVDASNEYIQEKKPWETKDKKVLGTLINDIKKISILLYPFIPDTCEKIAEKLGGYEFTLEEFGKPLDEKAKITKGEALFARIASSEPLDVSIKVIQPKIVIDKPNLKKDEEPNEIMENVITIQFDDFAKVQLKVAQIKEVEEIEGADKLWKLNLDDGSSEGRTICAGIKEFYTSEELQGKKIIIVANLAPRKLRGIESEGMLLAASSEDHSKVSLLTPDKDIEVGCLVG